MAVAIPVFILKQSDRFAAQLNSPPLTWISQCVALRKGMMPGSRRWTSAPSETKSNAPSDLMLSMIFSFNFVVFENFFPAVLRLQDELDHFAHRALAAGGLGDVVGDPHHL